MTPADNELIDGLVVANRILADQGILDGFGHVSVRSRADPGHFLMSRARAPGGARDAAALTRP